MISYFISDDAFFLYGLTAATGEKSVCSVFIDLNEKGCMKALRPVAGDIVVVAVNHYLSRKKILQMSIMPFCRVVVMLDIPIKRNSIVEFPCLVSKKMSLKEFLHLIHFAGKLPVSQMTLSKRILNIINQVITESFANWKVPGLNGSVNVSYRIEKIFNISMGYIVVTSWKFRCSRMCWD